MADEAARMAHLEAENAVLRRALAESQQRQTATSEILRAIADAPTDLDAVFDALARNAARVCGADDSMIDLVDGEDHYWVAHHGPFDIRRKQHERMPISRTSIIGRALLDRQTVHILDAAAVSPDELPRALE